MIRSSRLVATACGLALALSACSSEKDSNAKLIGDVFKSAAASVQGKNKKPKGKQPYTVITRSQLENTKIPALQVNLERRGGSDFLKRSAQRRDGQPGTVAVWNGAFGAQLFVRNGVLIGTRGIGGDIVSADVTPTVRAIQNQQSGGGEKRYFISDGSFSDVELVLSCDIENLGPATTQVVHLTYKTVHMRETCVGGAGDKTRIVNEYWVQPGSGLVRRSRQWAGPYSGHFEMILLRN